MALAVNKLVQAVYTAFAYTKSKFIQTEKAYIGHWTLDILPLCPEIYTIVAERKQTGKIKK